MPESLVVSVNFPLVILISLIESLKLPAEILLLSLQPGVVRGEGGEPSHGGGGGVVGLPGWGCSLQFSAASASHGQPNNAHNHCLLFCSDCTTRSTTELVSTRTES